MSDTPLFLFKSGISVMLRRKIQKTIQDYYRSGSNKVLLLEGARQIGKSFIIRHEGKKFYPNYIEINFMEDKNGAKLFAGVSTTKDFYLKLSANVVLPW